MDKKRWNEFVAILMLVVMVGSFIGVIVAFGVTVAYEKGEKAGKEMAVIKINQALSKSNIMVKFRDDDGE